jgi:hypothetical protein
MNVTATGVVAKSISRRQTGVGGQMTLVISPENLIVIDLLLDQTRAQQGNLLGMDKGAPVHEATLVKASFKSKVSVPSGQAVAVQAVAEPRAAGTGQTLLVISARVLGASANPR